MMPRGAGSGTSRRRLVSLCSTYCEFWRTCVRKKAPSSSTKATTSPPLATRARFATSFGWKLMDAPCARVSCGLRFEQRPHDRERDDSSDRGYGTRERGPHEHL